MYNEMYWIWKTIVQQFQLVSEVLLEGLSGFLRVLFL